MNKKPNTKKVTSVLDEAAMLINGDRADDYGDSLTNFAQIANLWTATLGLKLTAAITPEEVAFCMMQVKIARLVKSPEKRDSTVDVAGYAGCVEKVQAARNAGELPGGMLYDAGAKS